MKTLISAIIILSSIIGHAATHTQKERLLGIYEVQDESLFLTLYWLPETSQTVQKFISDNATDPRIWSGFDSVLWNEIPKEKQLNLLVALGAELDQMEEKKLKRFWKRLSDWRLIHSKLTLIATYLNQDMDFVEFAYTDPTLRPGFQWILDNRPPSFDPKHISDTIATGETVSVFPKLVEHLLETPERQRLECYSRLLARLAETKPAEQAGAGQPDTRSEPESAGGEKPQPEAEGRTR